MAHAGGYPASLKSMEKYAPVIGFEVHCSCAPCQVVEPGWTAPNWETCYEDDLELTATRARNLFLQRGWKHSTDGRWFAPGHMEAENDALARAIAKVA